MIAWSAALSWLVMGLVAICAVGLARAYWRACLWLDAAEAELEERLRRRERARREAAGR